MFGQSNKEGKNQESTQSIPHLTPHGKVINTQLDTTNESKEVSPIPAGDHKVPTDEPESTTNTRQNNIKKTSLFEIFENGGRERN